MRQLRTKSPTRIDLAGGFLDIWPVYALFRDCCVINCSIPVFTSVHLQFKETSEINVEILWPSGAYKKSFLCLQDCLKEPASELTLLQEHLRYWHLEGNCFKNGFYICLKSESPIGAGLGGSSSLGISLSKVFSAAVKKKSTFTGNGVFVSGFGNGCFA